MKTGFYLIMIVALFGFHPILGIAASFEFISRPRQ